MGTRAQRVVLGPFFSGGELVTSPRIYHYIAGTSSLLDCWSSRDKDAGNTVAQPFVGDASGIATFFGDGVYKIVVKDSAGTTLHTWDDYVIREAQDWIDAQVVYDPPILTPDTLDSAFFAIDGARVGDYVQVGSPFAMTGYRLFGYVTGTDEVEIRLENNSGVSEDLSSQTWNIRVWRQ